MNECQIKQVAITGGSAAAGLVLGSLVAGGIGGVLGAAAGGLTAYFLQPACPAVPLPGGMQKMPDFQRIQPQPALDPVVVEAMRSGFSPGLTVVR